MLFSPFFEIYLNNNPTAEPFRSEFICFCILTYYTGQYIVETEKPTSDPARPISPIFNELSVYRAFYLRFLVLKSNINLFAD